MNTNWLTHVKKTMKLNRGKPLKDVLKIAKATYKKGSNVVGKAVKESIKSAKKTTKTIRKTLRMGGKKHKTTKTHNLKRY